MGVTKREDLGLDRSVLNFFSTLADSPCTRKTDTEKSWAILQNFNFES